MANEIDLIRQVERVLGKFAPVKDSWFSTNLASGFQDTVAFYALRSECVALGNHIYGADHPQAQQIAQTIRRSTLHHLEAVEGILLGTIEALRHGLLNELRTQVLLDIKSDFLEAARSALEQDSKDVAAVLTVVVLEDSCKRLAIENNLDSVANKEFSVVVVELLKAGAIAKSTKGALLAFKDLRNSALHAQWHEVSAESVQALLFFLPTFMEHHGV